MGSGPGHPGRSFRYRLVALLGPPVAALVIGALPQDRVRVEWDRLLMAGALYGLAGWVSIQLASSGRWRRWRELLLVLGSLAAVLALGEVLLRTLRPYDSLPRFRWLASHRYHHVNPPGQRMFSGYVDGAPILVETNQDGFRSRSSRVEFRRHAVRIAVLGDSFVFGSGVNQEDAFPARLEGILRQRLDRSDIGVLNAGVISHSPLLEKLLFQGVVVEYRPTLVVLFLDATDIGDDSIYAAKAGPGPEPRFALEGSDRLTYHGAVHQLLKPPLAWLGGQLLYPVQLVKAALGIPITQATSDYYSNYVTFEGRPENRYFIYRHPLERTEPYFRETLRQITEIAAATERAGARFALVLVPRYHHWSRRECPQNWELGAYQVDEPYQYEFFRFFGQRRGEVGFPILDLLPAFRATSEFPLVFTHDPHWNARGHRFVAGTLAEYLIAESLVPVDTTR